MTGVYRVPYDLSVTYVAMWQSLCYIGDYRVQEVREMTKQYRDKGQFRLRQKDNGSYEVTVTLPKDANGKYPQKSFSHASKKEARKRAEAYMKSISAGVDVAGGSIATRAWLNDFIEAHDIKVQRKTGKGLANSTKTEYERSVRVLNKHLGDTPLNQLVPLQVERAIWADDASNNVAKKRYIVLNMALQMALYANLVENNVTDRVEAPNIQRVKTPVFFDYEDLNRLNAVTKGTRYEAPTNIQLLTGCRGGELLGLKWQDIDWSNKRINIVRSVDSFTSPISLKDTKNGEEASVPIGSAGIEILKAHRQTQRMTQMKSRVWVDNDLIFPNIYGGLWDYGNYLRGLKPLLVEAGLETKGGKNVATHAFRHTTAAILLSQGESLPKVARHLRHKKIATTDEYYAHLIQEDDDASDILGQFVG